MMRISQLACSLGVFFYASVAHADLMPPGGEGVSECRNKKAGDACERMFIDDGGWRREPGTCVKENLDHLPLKFKAHLRCIPAPSPSASASAAAPPASVVPTAPVVSSAVVAPKAPTPAPSVAADTPKSSGGCSFAHEPAKGAAFAFVVLALGLLLRKRERVRF